MKLKNQSITIVAGLHDPVLDNIIRKKDADFKELAQKNANHFASRNQPELKGGELAHYIGEFKAGYEKLAADVLLHLQPAANLPEGKMDLDFHKEKDEGFNTKIKKQQNKNDNEKYDLGNFNPRSAFSRIWLVGIITFIIMLGEILFNTKAFQVTGENMLFALILSISVSFAVFVFSHLASFLYKEAKTVFQRRLVICLSLLIVTALFIALALLRTIFLASHGVQINPFFFVIINLFFFIVSALLSFFVLPPWKEIKHNVHLLRLYRSIQKRKAKIKKLENEKDNMKMSVLESSKTRVRIMHQAKYYVEVIRKMYLESVAIFKRTNLMYREDQQTPGCFSDEIPELEINDTALNLISREAS